MKRVVILATLAVCLILLVFRFWLAVNAKHGDMYNSLDWGNIAVDYGLLGFYDLPRPVWPHSVVNQPAGSIYLHATSVLMDRSLDKMIKWSNDQIPIFPSKLVWWWEWNGNLVTIKFYSLLSDFIIAASLLSLARSFRRPRLGIIAALAYLVNPALWYSSAFWGHTDAVVAALSLSSLAALVSRRLVISPVLFGLSLAIKASWAPMVPFYCLYYLLNHRSHIRSLLLVPLVTIVLFIPFHPSLDLPFWLPKLYFQRILPGDTGFITILAFNFWNLVFGPYGVPYTTPVWGVPANLVAWSIVGAISLFLAYRLVKNPSPRTFFWVCALEFFAVFLFAPKMIHRYFYPVLPLASVILIFTKFPKLLSATLVITSALYLINIYYRWWGPGIPALIPLYTPVLMNSVSVAYLAIFVLWFKAHLTHAEG